MPDTSPWDQITVPKSDFNVLLVPGDRAAPCFWARDAAANCLFLVELAGDHSAQYRSDAVTVNGLVVDLRSGGNETQRLVLTLQRQIDRDLFESLCRALASAISVAGDATSALAIALAHLKRWKLFLAGRVQHLSDEAVRGLFGELWFLRTMIAAAGDNAAVEAWLGPEKSHQDFIFGNSAVEVKALSGAERNAVTISSEDQLESLNDHLFLRIYRLSALATSENAYSLNSLVIAIQSELATAEARTAFDTKLVAHGYAPLPEYDLPPFVVSETRTYAVTGAFPRLMRSALPQGLAKVSYNVQLEVIRPFLVDDMLVFEGR